MRKYRGRFFGAVVVLLLVCVSSTSFVSTASATLISGSAGTVNLIGNDPANPTGSFKVEVVYSVYDGKSTSDPLGLTSNLQIAFTLTHLGSGGESPVLKFGRFSVFAPVGFGMGSPFYLSQAAVSTGKVPSSMDIDPPPYPPTGNANRAKFYFQTGALKEANFASGEISQLLVVTIAPGNFPANSVLLEINSTNSVPGVTCDLYVNLIPEPCSLSIFAGAFYLFHLRNHRRRQYTEPL